MEYSDNGSGLNMKKIMTSATSHEILGDKLDSLTDIDKAHLIFEPGLTTTSNIDKQSGRGVGMDIIKKTLLKLGGNIYIEFINENEDKDIRPFRIIITLPGNAAVSVNR